MRVTVLIRRLCSSIVIAFMIFYAANKHFPDVYNHVEHSTFVQLDTCPLCFGHSFCEKLLMKNYARMTGLSKIKLYNYFNVKNIFYAQLQSGTEIVIKKLSWDSEIASLGKQFCEMVDMSTCDEKNAVRIYGPVFMDKFQTQSVKSRAIFGLKDILACPSKRFLTLMLNTFMASELSHVDYDRMDALAEFLTILHLNPEPLIIQTFKAEDGWPFPVFYGQCGRVVVEENAGKPLADFLSSSWTVRTQLSYQLLRIAEKLTFNPTNFSFYLTDVNLHNFAVSVSGQLTIVDAENVIVVDKEKDWQDQPRTWNKTLTNTDFGCTYCLSYSVEDLCTHHISDHNFYAMCRGIIGPNSYYADAGGLLHSIPESIERIDELKNLIKECSSPVGTSSRIVSGVKLMSLLLDLTS